MNREILFRGIHSEYKTWVDGSYYIEIDPYRSDEARHFIISGNMRSVHPVLPETVGQFTGLVDKNGVKIFEGDELRYTFKLGDPVEGIVKWHELHTHFSCLANGEYYSISMGGSNVLGIEVTGNIHE